MPPTLPVLLVQRRQNPCSGQVYSPFWNDPPHSDSGRTRTKDKYRVVYSDHQRLELEKEFHYSRYITIRSLFKLAALGSVKI